MGRAVTEKVNIDEDGYETVRRQRSRTLGQYMPEIFAVEAEGQGYSKDNMPLKLEDSAWRELLKTKWCKSGCHNNSCNHQGCGERVRSSIKEIGSVERTIQKTKGEVN